MTLITTRATTSTFGFKAPQAAGPMAVGAGTVTGTVTTPAGSSVALTGTVTSSANEPSVAFCGTCLGFYVVPGRPDEKEAGVLSFTIVGAHDDHQPD